MPSAAPRYNEPVHRGLARLVCAVRINYQGQYKQAKLKIKGPNATSYKSIEAEDGEDNDLSVDIYYPNDDSDYMFAGHADITQYVKDHGLGDYYVADLALIEGKGDGTGYYGGWSIVVVYANSSLKWRDITVFDGYAFVYGGRNSNTYQIDILDGFNSAISGDFRVKMGFMGGEGDRGIERDYFRIKN